MKNRKAQSSSLAFNATQSSNQAASPGAVFPQRLDTRQAAAFLGVQPSSLKYSRHTGQLCGVTTPAYRKLGRRVIYDLGVLQQWLDQFGLQTNTGIRR